MNSGRMAVVCQYQDEIRQELQAYPDAAKRLDQVLHEGRSGSPTREALELLDDAVRKVTGDDRGLGCFDENDYLAGITADRGDGYSGGAQTSAQGARLLGERVGTPDGARLYCPERICSRSWQRRPTEKIPACHVSGSLLD